ncbi:MAG TPA: hypothetical protein VMT73_14610 [Anaerolineales bacterium]|nr:hypothetical protein [Anaerolineales bacterium]
MRRFLQSEKSIPALFAVVTVLAYGLLLPYTGFHWDDWGFAWIAKFLGPADFIPAFRGFRPFLGPIFFLTANLIPTNPLYWQIFALVIRFLIGLSTWWMLKSFFPNHPRFALTAALFVLIFPGYSQHWVAFTHINQELIPFIFYLLSFGLSAHAIRKHNIPLAILALALQFAGLFPTEYFFGFEPLRFLFIWFMLDETNFWLCLRRALLFWLPYLLLWIVDAAWLFSLYHSNVYVSYGIQTSQTLNLLSILTALADALFKAGLYVWGQILFLAGSTFSAPTSLLTFGLIAATFALLAFYGSHLNLLTESTLALPALLIGLIGILLGRIPSLAAGLPLTLQSTFDRFMISMTLGGSLFFAGLVELIFQKSQRLKIIIISLVVALGIGQQFFNANLFRRDWARQQEIYWQIAWRIPALKPNTLILTDKIPDMPLETDLSFTAPVNWIYAPNYSGGDVPYALLYTEARLGGGTLPELQPHMNVTLPLRTVNFHGSTDSALVILVPENGCLRVLDPALGDAETYEKESNFLLQAIPYSNPSQIITNASQPNLPNPPFINEPSHTWCYFYEKAELARQTGDWEEIVKLAKQAGSLGEKPEDVFEWLPFIEADAHTDNLDEAVKLSQDSVKSAARVRKGVCNVWKRIQAQVPEGSERASEMLQEFGCLP